MVQFSHPYMTPGKTIALTAAAAKSLQSWPTLCDSIDGSPPGSIHFHQEALYFFAFCHKGGVICISEVFDISPGNLDSNLCFIQSSTMYSAYKLNKQSDNIQPCYTPFPNWNQSPVPCQIGKSTRLNSSHTLASRMPSSA